MAMFNSYVKLPEGISGSINLNHPILVGGAITILKNMKVNGKDYPIYYGK